MWTHHEPCTSRVGLAIGLLTLFIGATAARADVIVVDPQGGHGIDMLQAAISSSHAGDVILLKAGDYRPWSQAYWDELNIYGEGITLVADADAGTVKLATITADSIPVGQTTVLRGIDIKPSVETFIFADAVRTYAWTTHNSGALWIEDCTLAGNDALFFGGHWVGAYNALDSYEARVIVTHSIIAGGDGHISPPPQDPKAALDGGTAISAFNSSLVIADSVVRGGHGGANWKYPIGAGVGIYFQQMPPFDPSSTSFVWISGSQVLGGDEGADDDLWCIAAPAVVAVDPGNILAERDSTVAAGHQLPDHWKWVPDTEGIAPDSVIAMPAAARSCHVPAPARANTLLSLSIHGQPGDAVLLLVSNQADAWPRPQLQGSLGIEAPGCFVLPPLTITDPSGDADIPFRLPEVPPVFGGGTTLFIQGVFAGADGVTLGAPTALIWLGSGY